MFKRDESLFEMQNLMYIETLKSELVIMEQELTLEQYDHCDDWFSISCNYVQDRYFSVMQRPRVASIPIYADDPAYTIIQFTLNGQENVTVRQAYNLFNYLSDIGGFFGIIFSIGSYFNLVFSSTLNKVTTAQGMFKIPNSKLLPKKQMNTEYDLKNNIDWLKDTKLL